MIAHRQLDEGGNMKQFLLLLPDAGNAELARLHGKHVGVKIPKSVANLVDHQGEPAVSKIAEIDRQRIEGEAEHAGEAQGTHPPAGQGETLLDRANLAL